MVHEGPWLNECPDSTHFVRERTGSPTFSFPTVVTHDFVDPESTIFGPGATAFHIDREQLQVWDTPRSKPGSRDLRESPLPLNRLARTRAGTNPFGTESYFSNYVNHIPHAEEKALHSNHARKTNMTKKRRSLQSLLIPAFLQLPPTPASPTSFVTSPNGSRLRSHSSAEHSIYYKASIQPTSALPTSQVTSPSHSPPPDFLIDEDPFANLSSPKPISSDQQMSTQTVNCPPAVSEKISNPKSPLIPTETTKWAPMLPSAAILTADAANNLPLSMGRPHARPAHQRPAFAPRPSLPSLHTLARMNVAVPRRVRKGRVGAGLPHEPWDMEVSDSDKTSGGESSGSKARDVSLPTMEPSSSSFSNDFVADLELDFLDLSEDDPDDEDDLQELPFGYDESSFLPYSRDTDRSLEYSGTNDVESFNDCSLSSLSRTTSSELLSTLPRSTSSTSRSSSESSNLGDAIFSEQLHTSPVSEYESTEHTQSSSSAESEGDILNSPPDDFFSFPESPYQISSSDLHWTHGYRCDPRDADDPSSSSAFSGVDFLPGNDLMYQPGTSAGTIRAAVNAWASSGQNSSSSRSHQMDDGVVDGGGWDEGQGGGSRRGHIAGSSGLYGGGSGSGRGNGGRYNGDGLGGGWRGGNGSGAGDDDGRDDRRRPNRSNFSTPSSSSEQTSDDDSDEESADDYGEPALPPTTVLPANVSGSDDDVPLAQRIPTALSAQKTIRRQVREERDQRRRERMLRSEQRGVPRIRQTSTRPAGAGDPRIADAVMSSSQEAALHASKSIRREPARTLPAGNFAPEDLARKLQSVQVANAFTRFHHSPSPSKDNSMERPRTADRPIRRDLGHTQPISSPTMSPPPEPSRSLRPSKSFHRQDVRPAEENTFMAAEPEHKLGRSSTSTRPTTGETEQRLGRSVTSARPRERSQSTVTKSRSVPAPSSFAEHFHLFGKSSGEERAKLVKAHPEAKSTRSSTEAERAPRTSTQRPPVPPLPITEGFTSLHAAGKGQLVQQRIFIGDLQRFNMVELAPNTNAGDVIDMVEAQGTLKGWVGVGGWMVWEVAQDFGMERPIRSYELLSDVQASWNKDKMINAFIIKLTPLASLLSRSNIPSSSPTFAGYVEWESKRGKWSKRWLTLREHSLWLAKRDNGKDEVLLCSLSNFDGHFMTRLHKAPKPFVFAVKSTDNLSFFENTADYLHIFSCSQKDGDKWMERILLARSYVLHQERHVLFNPKAIAGNSAGGSTTLSRAGTRKTPASHRPTQPLVAVPDNNVFEPGSLLHKHA